MDARAGGRSDGFPGFVDVAAGGAGQPADHRGAAAVGRVAHFDGDAPHGFQVIRGGGREARFDHIHAQAGQRARHFQLFGAGHGRAGGLLAVAQGGVEDAYVGFH